MRRRLSLLLLKLQYLPPCTEEKIFNLLMPLFFLILMALATACSIICDKKTFLAVFAYVKDLESQWAQKMFIFFKLNFLFFAYPAFPCLIAIVYCTICVRCSYAIRNLTHKISLCSPEQFGPSEQIHALRYKAKIDEILQITQEIFSVPSFCLIVANSISCYSTLGWYLMSHLNAFQLIEVLSIGMSSLLCMTCIRWTAGTLPGELNKLKDTFYAKAYLRWISFRFPSEKNFRREVLDKPEFVFTGCDIFHYRRSFIFAVVETLIN
ncbi:uncharacterized protein TNIN_1101 [Trichonephila inaurata madagascariensis]|uniref:Uncharacterized protein n=1 Tax=Trichonephila inaurata madagascariensis TaxID=2747483 RepID=A0A8X6YHP3_9ARAC|nr:uncharacterized protein TNIN_1101 [Trichonephila inaurata madagascariensis]